MKSSINQTLNLNDFNNLLQEAKIIDCNYPLAALVWRPYGYKILKLNELFLEKIFEKYNYQRCIFPFLISSREFNNINDKINSFEKGIFKITENMVLRPSGESAIYPMFRRWIKSEYDLPIRIFQIGSMFRAGRTRGFMRPNENDFFVEAHSAFSSKEEVEQEIKNCNSLVEEYAKWLAIPTLKTLRPVWTNNPVAEKEYAFDVLLPIGETSLLNVTYSQMQIFSKAFNVVFTTKEGVKDFTYQTEFGFSQRAILNSIWLLSNKESLFLLPSYAPVQIVIVQIDPNDSKLSKYVEKISELLELKNIRLIIDQEKKQLFKRFAKYEKIGVPVRLEVGENELTNSTVRIVRHDNWDKTDCHFDDTCKVVEETFQSIIFDAFKRNKEKLIENILHCNNGEAVREIVKAGKIAKINLCSCENCVKEVQAVVGLGEVIGFDYENCNSGGECINCHKQTLDIAFYARRV